MAETVYGLHYDIPEFNMSGGDVGFDNAQEMALNTYRRDLLTYHIAIATTIVCCLGLVGNILSLIVLTRKSMNSTTYIYLTGLAVCDLLVLLFTMIIVAEDTRLPKLYESKWLSNEYAYLFPWVHPLATTFQVTSIWLTLAFTVDRFIMICHPFQAQRLCTKKRARITIVLLSFGGILFNIPKFFEYETQVIQVENDTHAISQLTTFGRSSAFGEIFHSWLYITFVCGVPFLSLAILNGFLIHAVHRSRKKGREINASDQKRNDTTIMLIGVVVVFFICQAPALISRIIWAFDPYIAFTNSSIHILGEVSNFLITLNSAINFVPYFFFGQRFRRECKKVICRCGFTNGILQRLSIFSASEYRRGSEMSYTSKITRLTINGSDKSPRLSGITEMWTKRQSNGDVVEECIPITEVNHNREKEFEEVHL